MVSEQQHIAEKVLAEYQKRRKPWGASGYVTDMPGYQLQAYQNWRTEWMQACLQHMDRPDYTSSSVLTAQVDVDKCKRR